MRQFITLIKAVLDALLAVRWIAVWRRNLLVWRKQMAGSLVSHIAEPLISLLAFGYGLGALVKSVQTAQGSVAYLVFIASGLVCASTMMTTSFEALFSAFSRLDHQRTWHGILNAAVLIEDVVWGELFWAAFKGLFAATVIFCVICTLFALQGLALHIHLILVVPILTLVALCFASLGMIVTAKARGYDFFSFYMTLFLTPMMFVSGYFFPREHLPSFLRVVSEYLPLTSAVALVRPLFLGQWPPAPWPHVLSLLGITALASLYSIALLRRRFTL